MEPSIGAHSSIANIGEVQTATNRSAAEILLFKVARNLFFKVTIHEVEGADHLGILADARTIQVIKDTIYNPPV